MEQVTGIRYLTCVETAKLLRADLKRKFPGTRFSVRSNGNTIYVRWKDGPDMEDVNPVFQQFSGATYDFSIEVKQPREHWLLPDGRVTLAHDPGTIQNRGIMPSMIGMPPSPDAELVQFGAEYVLGFRVLQA